MKNVQRVIKSTKCKKQNHIFDNNNNEQRLLDSKRKTPIFIIIHNNILSRIDIRLRYNGYVLLFQ